MYAGNGADTGDMLSSKMNEMDMCTGPLMKKLVLYSVPLICTGVLQLLFNAADIIVVGRFAGRTALAAVGATTSLTNLLVNLFMMTSIGVSVVAARHYGAHEYEDVGDTVSTAMVFSALVGVAVGLVGIFGARSMLSAMDCPADVLDQAALYMRLYFTGIPGLMVYNFGAAALRAVGDTRRPLQFLTVAGVANVILNLIMVIWFRMGVAGVAIATSVSQYISAAFVCTSLIRTESCLHFDIGHAAIHRGKLLEIISIGLPAGLQSAVFGISNVMIQSTINTFGSAVMAGSSASYNLESFTYVSMSAVVQAAMAFTGQNMGAREYRRVPKILGRCLLLVLAVGGGVSLLLCVFSEELLGIYAKGDAQVIYWGVTRLIFLSTYHVMMGLVDVIVGVMRGMGHSTLPMLISIFGICGLRIAWLYTFFAAEPTFIMLLTGYPVSWAITLACQFTCYLILKARHLSPAMREQEAAGL